MNRHFLSLFSILIFLILMITGCNGGKEAEITTSEATVQAEAETTEKAETQIETEADTSASEESTDAETTAEEITREDTTVPDVLRQEPIDVPYAADFTVSNAFSSDMVVQRNEFIRVWGWADQSENGKKVSGEFMGMFAETVIENGEWVITFTARQSANASTGNTLKIYTDRKIVEFNDVLVGDVFMVIGQSNVAYTMNEHMQYCNNENQGGWNWLDYDAPIRLNYNSYTVKSGYPEWGTTDVVKDVKDNNGWTKAEKNNLGNFSAVGYYTAVHLLKKTGENVPIGLIEIDGNGLPLSCFIGNELADTLNSDIQNENAPGTYWTKGVMNPQTPSRFMYNQYMFPFEKYAIAGIVWYQGESDYPSDSAMKFREKFTSLMTYMRGTHNLLNRDFPVFMVEFPSVYYGTGNAYWDIGEIRGIVGTVPNTLSNCYVASSSDLWADKTFQNNLHPSIKYEQGERIASIIANVIYGKGTRSEVCGPIATSIEIAEDSKSAVITFDNVGDGLKTCDGGTDVNGILVMKKDLFANFQARVTAKITAPNQITITSSQKIIGMSYNIVTENFYRNEINLCNSYGMPAVAFILYPD